MTLRQRVSQRNYNKILINELRIIHGVIIKLFVNKKPMKSHGEKGGYLSDQQ